MTEKKRNPGRPHGTTKDRVKIGTTISRINAEWIAEQKKRGKAISFLIDAALNKLREEN